MLVMATLTSTSSAQGNLLTIGIILIILPAFTSELEFGVAPPNPCRKKLQALNSY